MFEVMLQNNQTSLPGEHRWVVMGSVADEKSAIERAEKLFVAHNSSKDVIVNGDDSLVWKMCKGCGNCDCSNCI